MGVSALTTLTVQSASGWSARQGGRYHGYSAIRATAAGLPNSTVTLGRSEADKPVHTDSSTNCGSVVVPSCAPLEWQREVTRANPCQSQ